MKTDLALTGIHHLTAISADIRENKRFYTEDLGLRLVKRTVNQDDTSAYHLFYADGAGSPGTDLTFFDWPLTRERRGNRSVTRTALRVRDETDLAYWTGRFDELGLTRGPVFELDERLRVDFEDREGQRLALVTDGGLGDAPVVWDRSPVPAEHQLRGLGPITLTVPVLAPTDAVVREVMRMRPAREYPDPESPRHAVHVYEMGHGGPHAELHVAVRPDLAQGRQGAGGVHHVAFRTPTDAEYGAWAERLDELGVPNSGPVDRFWFRSLYFREPGGVLFEIATDGPGFGVDEDLAALGDKVVLAPFLEPRRHEIVARLKALD